VIDRSIVVNVPTLRALASSAEPTPLSVGDQANRLLAIGNPIYGQDSLISPRQAADRVARLARGTESDQSEWPRLPASEEEMRQLNNLFGLQHSVTLFEQAQASVATVRELDGRGALKQARWLIFSAHGYADRISPDLSSLVLSAPPGEPESQRLLTAAEIAALRLGTDVTFFSACEAGVGDAIAGEGVLSLGTAALIAGSHTAVQTLWRIDDQAAADFAVKFFARLKAGSTASEALVETKREFANSRGTKEPRYWAGYMLLERLGVTASSVETEVR
ncbi:MAG: CHAT domain-containing protein, partial [Burkholderiaceae bacterium]